MSMTNAASHLALLAIGCSLMGCGDTERNVESGSRDIAGVALLDNLEDGNTQTLQDEAGYKGFWYTYDDKTECDNMMPEAGMTWPPPSDESFPMTAYADAGLAPPPEGDDNKLGARFTGADHALWGAGMGFTLLENAPFDLAAAGFVGLRFWGISPGGPQAVQIKVPDDASNPTVGMCVPRDATLCNKQGCHADPAVTVEFGPEWKLYKVYFTKTVADDATTASFETGPMVPPSWGVYNGEKPSMLNPSAAYQVQFQVGRVSSPGFDIWVDNVGLILAGGAEDVAVQ